MEHFASASILANQLKYTILKTQMKGHKKGRHEPTFSHFDSYD